MPAVRLERLPVPQYGLGYLGFDHLQIVFQPDAETSAATRLPDLQAYWHVMEGLRDTALGRPRLAIDGWHGGMTLSEANGGAVGDALIDKIGTPTLRGSRVLADGGEAFSTWGTLVSFAADLHQQDFPYVAYALPHSPLPTVNSSSVVSSLLAHAGFDVGASLPKGLRLSPGLTTLLGTSADDRVALGQGPFTSVLAGTGRDHIVGASDSKAVDKLYGGRGDDVLGWSRGFNVLHGGQPSLPYALDGDDTVDYSGVGTITISAGTNPNPHTRPDFVTRFAGGTDHIFSIEELRWDDANDTIVLGRDAGLRASRLRLSLGGGDDQVDARGGHIEADIDCGAGDDYVLAGDAALRITPGDGADRIVLASPKANVTISDADSSDRLVIPWTVKHAHVAVSPSDKQDVVFRLVSDYSDTGATVRIRNYEAGDLGLSLSPFRAPAPRVQDFLLLSQMPIDAMDTGRGETSTEASAVSHLFMPIALDLEAPF